MEIAMAEAIAIMRMLLFAWINAEAPASMSLCLPVFCHLLNASMPRHDDLQPLAYAGIILHQICSKLVT
jgi:hypothetical protein